MLGGEVDGGEAVGEESLEEASLLGDEEASPHLEAAASLFALCST